MLKKLLPLTMALLLTLTACGSQTADPAETETTAEDNTLTLCATTYPVYLFASEVTRGAENVSVELMINQPVSCLHDYTLSVDDMKKLEQADAILLSGAGLEDSMGDALNAVSDTPVIDCSQEISLLTTPEGEDDPHIWLAPANAAAMVNTIAAGLTELDRDNAALYAENAAAAEDKLLSCQETLSEALSGLTCRELITFHDGFQYFANAFDLTILRAIEEEAGSEASAQEAGEIIAEVQSHSLPAIFTEKNGATATAEMIQRECGVKLAQLDLMMSGDTENPGIDTYLTLLEGDVNAVSEAYS